MAAVSLLFYGCSAKQPRADPAPGASTSVATASIPPTSTVDPTARRDVVEEQGIAPLARENSVFFTLRSAKVGDEGMKKLRSHADRLKQDRERIVTLIGYSDGLGSRSYNLAITEDRIVAVSHALRKFGVPARQIRRDRGHSVRTQVACSSTQCRDERRRVELVYSP